MNRLAALSLCVALVALGACSGTTAFYKAHPPETAPQSDRAVQFSKKVLQHFNVIGKEIVTLRADPSVTDRAKEALLGAYRQGVCSAAELEARTGTPECRKGPAWELDHLTGAWTAAGSAQDEAQMQAAVDALAAVISDLIDLIAGARS